MLRWRQFCACGTSSRCTCLVTSLLVLCLHGLPVTPLALRTFGVALAFRLGSMQEPAGIPELAVASSPKEARDFDFPIVFSVAFTFAFAFDTFFNRVMLLRAVLVPAITL